MCNYSGYVMEKGIEKGTRIGLEKGTKIGLEKGTKIGISKGEERVKLLLKKLAADIGWDAAYEVIMNPDLQQEYYKKYGI